MATGGDGDEGADDDGYSDGRWGFGGKRLFIVYLFFFYWLDGI